MTELLHQLENRSSPRMNLEKLGNLVALAETQETNLHSAQIDNRLATMVIGRMNRN